MCDWVAEEVAVPIQMVDSRCFAGDHTGLLLDVHSDDVWLFAGLFGSLRFLRMQTLQQCNDTLESEV